MCIQHVSYEEVVVVVLALVWCRQDLDKSATGLHLSPAESLRKVALFLIDIFIVTLKLSEYVNALKTKTKL